MTYQIYYIPKGSKEDRRYVMFEIESYISESKVEKDYYISDVRCFPRVKGITLFLRDKLNEYKFDCDEFVRCCEELEGIRDFLHMWYEMHKPKIYNEACDFNDKLDKVIEEKVEAFARKYDLYISVD